MKKSVVILLILISLLAHGCEYDVPVADKQDLPIDASLIGFWQSGGKINILISRYSDTEYSVRVLELKDKPIYMRGYPIVVAGVSGIQLYTVDEQYMPTNSGARYSVAFYEFEGGDLNIRILSADTELKSRVELINAFAKKVDDSEILLSLGTFKKVATNESK